MAAPSLQEICTAKFFSGMCRAGKRGWLSKAILMYAMMSTAWPGHRMEAPSPPLIRMAGCGCGTPKPANWSSRLLPTEDLHAASPGRQMAACSPQPAKTSALSCGTQPLGSNMPSNTITTCRYGASPGHPTAVWSPRRGWLYPEARRRHHRLEGALDRADPPRNRMIPMSNNLYFIKR